MDNKNQIGKSIAALLLFIALMLPSTVQFCHLLEDHEHITVTQETEHVEQSITKCEICSINFIPVNYDIALYPDLLLPKSPTQTVISFKALQLHAFNITNTQLRAPPIFS